MYIPRFNVMDDPDEVRAFVESIGSAHVVTTGTDGTPLATLLPILWSADGDTVVAHMARANSHWREIVDNEPVLMIIAGPQAYVSPSWYPSKADHGRVVPTWNYSAVHLTGTVLVHDDTEWVRRAVTELTDRHEQHRDRPWAVTDAPETYVEKNLRAIVGLEMTVVKVEAKAKLSQNRSAEDRAGVVAGLRREAGNAEVADAMALRDEGQTTRR
ncbi:FMN-binding negative transcriptional regulator [Aeromicrobium sp.]|uniref:FMN-binding negative transcriptional regulator n=1 Tax=Aeromicrobium sp. TaxID=1871063 RepID=UPI0019BF063E|nr:FMN-binding negative transcriptional regulator [Aeromicrobium sp.]MBC7633143.1 FMN-binding negative transcriptional regulator [Aeromicrobium sp.]